MTADPVALARDLMRCPSVTPAEGGALTFLETTLKAAGFTVHRMTFSEPGAEDVENLYARIGTKAPHLVLAGHSDVVPTGDEAAWKHPPFASEVADGMLYGRGAVDMLNLTSSMAVVFKSLVQRRFRPKGDLLYFAVADEEAGSAHGARWVAEQYPDSIRCTYLLTESGGLHSGAEGQHSIGINVAEKGVAWRRLRVRGTPGHGSMPFGSDNALIRAAKVVSRLADYQPTPRFHELWRGQVDSLGLPDDMKTAMLDENTIDDLLADLPHPGAQRHLHACTHTTFAPNVVATKGQPKTNVIPDIVDLDIDIRTMPGDNTDEVTAHLRAALGDDLFERVEIEVLMDDSASISRTDTPLWDSLQRAISVPFPDAHLNPQFTVGFTDARVFRDLGAVSYGAGLFSPSLDPSEFGLRFHGHNERVDVESLRLTTELWERVIVDLLG